MTSDYVAVDLGGTHVRAALVSSAGQVLRRCQEPTPHNSDVPTVVPRLMNAMSKGTSVTRASVGVPGVVDYTLEAMKSAPNLPQNWIEYLAESWLAECTGLEVSMANDADLAAVGESRFGAGSGCDDVVYVTISTGVGAGIVLGGKLIHGQHSGGELGSTVVDRQRSVSGQDGTVEGQGSGTALGNAAQDAGLKLDGAALAESVRSGDPAALAIWDNGMDSVAFGIINLCWLVAPQMVIIGGGVGQNEDIVIPAIEQRMEEHGPTVATPTVCPAMLGDDAALIGAAAWWEAIGRT